MHFCWSTFSIGSGQNHLSISKKTPTYSTLASLQTCIFLCTLKAWLQKRLAWIQVISSTYSFPISNSFDLVVLLVPPRAMQSWGNQTLQSLYIYYMYSEFIIGCFRLKDYFLKTCSLFSKNSIQVYHQAETHRLHPRQVWAGGCSLILFIVFISADFISPDVRVANPTSRHPSDKGLQYSQRSNVTLVSPVQKPVTHLHQLLVSRCQGFTWQPEVHADLQITSNSFSLGSLVYHPTFDIQIPIFKFHVFTYRVLCQRNWQRSCNYPV